VKETERERVRERHKRGGSGSRSTVLLSAKEPYIYAKEPQISTSKFYLLTRELRVRENT